MEKLNEMNEFMEEAENGNGEMLELSEEEMTGVSGGIDPKKKLSDYLKRIVHDKSKILVDNGTGKQLKLENHISAPDAGSIVIIPRERARPDTNADLVIK